MTTSVNGGSRFGCPKQEDRKIRKSEVIAKDFKLDIKIYGVEKVEEVKSDVTVATVT